MVLFKDGLIELVFGRVQVFGVLMIIDCGGLLNPTEQITRECESLVN